MGTVMIAEKSIYEHEVEELRQRCEKGCEEVEELRQRLVEVIRVRDRLQEEVQFLARERQNEQQEVSASEELQSHLLMICTYCACESSPSLGTICDAWEMALILWI